jgi:hypothetical protein
MKEAKDKQRKTFIIIQRIKYSVCNCILILYCSLSLFFTCLHYIFIKYKSKKESKDNKKVITKTPPASSCNLTSITPNSPNSTATSSSPIVKEIIRDKISIIISARNETRHIGKTIRNLENTTIDKSKVEIIIVLGENDNTMEIAKSYSGIIPIIFVKLFSENSSTKLDNYKLGRGFGYNHGLSKTTGEYILLIRADALVPAGYDCVIRRQFQKDNNILYANFIYGIDKTNFTNNIPSSLFLIESYFNIRSNLFKMPSAMQGIVISNNYFQNHQFSSNIILDDVDFFINTRYEYFQEKGDIITLDLPSVKLSSDRFNTIGKILKYIFIDLLSHHLYILLNFSDEQIIKYFYHKNSIISKVLNYVEYLE